MADYEDLGTDPMGQLADLMYEDPPQYNAGWSSPGGMMPAPQGASPPGLNALRQKLLGIVNEPIEQNPAMDEAQALSAAGAQLGAPAHNFWESLNKALYAYSSAKTAQTAAAEQRQLKAADVMDNLYRSDAMSSRLTAAMLPQAKVIPDVGLAEYNPMTQRSRVLIGSPLYQKLYLRNMEQLKAIYEKVPAEDFGGPQNKIIRMSMEADAWTRRQMQTGGDYQTGWGPGTLAPPGTGPGTVPPPGVPAQPGAPQATPQAAAPIDYTDLAGVPPKLLDSLRRVESNGDPFAVSPKGAMGPYQHMPSTAAAFRKRGWKYDPWDEEQARWATAQHLAELYKKYNNWDKTLAAYNAGEPAVDSGKASGFKETQQYVPNVLAGAGPLGTHKGPPAVPQPIPPHKGPTPPMTPLAPVTAPTKPKGPVPLPAATPPGTAQPGTASQGLRYKSALEEKDSEAYGGVRGKTLGEMEGNAAQLFSTASMAENQYNLLKKLYASNANIAEGAGAETWYNIKSWAKTLGIDLGNSTDLESNVLAITREIALKHRTMTEAGNLLPGAMSNYEDKLLQSIQPGLNLTREGRMLLLDFYTELARTNKRFAEEATNYIEQNGRLDEAWYQKRNRITREEMARLAHRQQAILKEYKARTKKGK